MDKHDKQELYREISAELGEVFDETDQEGLEHVAARIDRCARASGSRCQREPSRSWRM
jgi:hypothetical protein